MSEPTIQESLLLSRTEERDLARQEVNACHQALRLEREKTKRLREALHQIEDACLLTVTEYVNRYSEDALDVEISSIARAALEVSE